MQSGFVKRAMQLRVGGHSLLSDSRCSNLRLLFALGTGVGYSPQKHALQKCVCPVRHCSFWTGRYPRESAPIIWHISESGFPESQYRSHNSRGREREAL